MSEKLTDRLRGKYKIGPDGIYGTRDFNGFTPPICSEAADRIEELEQQTNAVLDEVESEIELKKKVHLDERYPHEFDTGYNKAIEDILQIINQLKAGGE